MSKKSSNNHLVLITFIIFLIGMYALLFKQTTRHTDMKLSLPLIEQSDTYTSEVLDISFVVPESHTITESGNFITLTSDKGTIHIDRISTNENNIRAYIQGLREKNNTNVQEYKVQYFGNAEAVETMIEDSELTYFLSPKLGRIFSLSTTSPELYEDLEAIIQSFEYLGE